MKKIVYLAIVLAIALISCKKQPIDPAIHNPLYLPYLTTVQQWLKDKLTAEDYAAIDFGHPRLSKQKSGWYLRLGLKGKSLETDFLLLQTDANGRHAIGKYIHLVWEKEAKGGQFNGSIEIQSMEKRTIVHSGISRGYIDAWHPDLATVNAKAVSLPDPYVELPEVIVTASIHHGSQGPSTYSYYISFQSIFNEGGYNGGSGGGFGLPYGAVGTAGGGSGGTGNGNEAWVYSPIYSNSPENIPGSLIPDNNDITIEFDKMMFRPAIDVNAWMKCFTDIPDGGATCSITLCADLPVDDDPSINVNLYTGATGHTFLQLKKTNGAQTVTQIIGFTAQNPLLALIQADDFVPGKTVDNAGHKFDASLTMNVNSEAFNTALENIRLLSATMAYSITKFDCLDYDLAVINSIRQNNPLILPKIPVAWNGFSMISTGEALYQLLADMKEQGAPEASNIFVGGPQFAGSSHGPCN